MDVNKEIAFFDQFEQEHGDYDVLAEESYERIISTLFRGLRIDPGMTCADLGCGTGAFTRRLSKLGLAMTGVDISPRSIERATTIGEGPQYLAADICNCPLPSDSFDFVTMSGVLHHLTTAAARVQSLREALRLLKPGGHFLSYDPNAASPSMFLYRDPRSPLYSQVGKTDNEVLLSRRQVMSELSTAGFSAAHAAGLSGIAYSYVEGRLARRLLPLYNRVYEPLIRWSPFETILGTFVVAVARKPATSPQTP
jgi:demethylmenaquinone methyltransferase/2-methoxy-6-polyprenyl-1,4-benzoquinol methylase